ncbi:scoloptoxin SSD14-like [Ixodes scapularis]
MLLPVPSVHINRRLFWNRVSRQVYRENEILRQPTLALTLIQIAHKGYGGFLQGDMGAKFLLDLSQLGALVSRGDLAQYRALWKVPVRSVPLGGVTVHAPPPPGAGSLLAFMLSTMDMFRSSKGDLMDEGALTYHRLVETFKFTLPFREDLGDDQFEDVGDTMRNMASRGQALKVNGRIADSSTYSDAIFYVFDMQLVRRSFSSLSERAHIARYTRGTAAHSRSHVRYGTPTKSAVTAKRGVKRTLDVRHGSGNAVFVAPNGDAIAFSASIGMLLGSREASSSTGLVLNNALHSFTARDPNRYLGHAGVSLNHPRPGKRPLSPLAPCVVLDGDRNLMAAVAASELFQVPQYSATILLELLFMNKTMTDAISAPKVRYRANVKGVLHDVDLPRSMVLELQKKGHRMFLMDDKITNAVGVSVDDDNNLYPGVNERVGGYFNGQ